MEFTPLFPKPVGNTRIDRELTEEEYNFCLEQKEKSDRNDGNLTSTDRNILESKELQSLKSFCNKKINEYFETVLAPSTDAELTITQSWLNFTDQGGFHHTHSHNNSFLSGVFYINTTDEDKIFFFDNQWEPFEVPSDNYNIYNSSSWWLPAETGSLLIFPSKLVHSVKPLEQDHTRISLSFNTFFKGTIGSKRNLTELTI